MLFGRPDDLTCDSHSHGDTRLLPSVGTEDGSMTYRMDVEAWTDVAYQLSPQEFKAYFCISMMIAQNDGTLVRDDRALARACNDPGKRLLVDQFRKQLNKRLHARVLNEPGRQARQSASARSSSATRATTVGMSATRLHAATAIACRSDLLAAVALSSSDERRSYFPRCHTWRKTTRLLKYGISVSAV